MNEEIEYAEMLEIPVSTVNVIKKNRRRKQKTDATQERDSTVLSPLKDSVIAQVNEKVFDSPEEITAEAELFAESANSNGSLELDFPDRIDTVRVYTPEEKVPFWKRAKSIFTQETDVLDTPQENEYSFEDGKPFLFKRILNAEFIAACALCGAIFLTNVFLPGSAINTFFRSLNNPSSVSDSRPHTEFVLSTVVGALSDAELNLSPTGILSFTDEGCVYPVADGKVEEIAKQADGTYRVKIAHSDVFSGIIDGLDYVYYQVGDSVKGNVPVGYSEGEEKVQITMYSDGELLNCFQLTDENRLAWITQE